MTRLALLVLLLGQAETESLQAKAASLDEAIRAVAGYDRFKESRLIGDAAFLKRVTKDLVDADASDAELRAFVDDATPGKRAARIAQLVGDERFDRVWASRFTRMLFAEWESKRLAFTKPLSRVEAGKEILVFNAPPPEGTETRMIRAFEAWLTERIRRDTPWTEIVAQMIDARGTLEADPSLAYLVSFNRGKDIETEFPMGVAKHFLGIRLYCAQCHDHPYDKWRVEDYYGLGAFIVRQRSRGISTGVEVKYADSGELMMPSIPGRKDAEVKFPHAGQVEPNFLFGGKPGKDDDRMKALAQFMTERRNTQFPRALANRVWGWLLGTGIVHPVDDFNLKNRPVSAALLELLKQDLIDNKYSLKHLVRLICMTDAYQMRTLEEQPDGVSFRHLAAVKLELAPAESRPGLNFSILYTPLMGSFEVLPKADRSGSRQKYRVPERNGLRFAELSTHDGKLGADFFKLGSILNPKTSTAPLPGNLKLTLNEISGMRQCKRGSEGPVDETILLVFAQTPGGWIGTFKFEGPTAVVNERREEFLEMLKAATSK